MARLTARLEDATLPVERQQEIPGEFAAVVKGAAPRQAGHLSRAGNMSVCLVFGHDGEARVVAGEVPGQEGIGRCHVANARQPQGLDRTVLQDL
jgi:hypothetical protein